MPLDNNRPNPEPTSPLAHRLGWITIPNASLRHNPEKFWPVFRRLIVVQTNYKWENNSTELLAYSPAFEVKPEGEAAPHYEATINTKTRRVKFTKIA